MMSSVDGRIVVRRWPEIAELDEYERTAETLGGDGWMCGRITMEPFAGATRSDEEIERERSGRDKPGERPDHVAWAGEERCAIALDADGRLRWQKSDIDGDHVVAVLSDGVSDEYLAYLREKGVSYILASPPDRRSRQRIDLGLALEKLYGSFCVCTLLLEGGGGINGSMLNAGLIDEISLLIAPVADGDVEIPTLFDLDAAAVRDAATRLTLKYFERRPGDIIWLRYGIDHQVKSRSSP